MGHGWYSQVGYGSYALVGLCDGGAGACAGAGAGMGRFIGIVESVALPHVHKPALLTLIAQVVSPEAFSLQSQQSSPYTEA